MFLDQTVLVLKGDLSMSYYLLKYGERAQYIVWFHSGPHVESIDITGD